MGDLRAGAGGSCVSPPTGKRVARHSAEQLSVQPYVGRRIAATPGRRRAEPVVLPAAPPSPFSDLPAVARRVDRGDVVPFALGPVVIEPIPPAPVIEAPVIEAPVVEAPVVEAPIVEAPIVEAPIVEAPVVEAPVVEAPVVEALVVEAPVVLTAITPEPRPRRRGTTGHRSTRRRSPIPLPSAPLLVGVAILGISAGGALQAMHPGVAGASDGHHLAPASALSGTSAVGTASVLGGRTAVVSRSSDRLQAAADAGAKQRAEALSGFASQAKVQSQKIKLHAWVLPVTVGVYHLTARFGDYSSLWSNFHTGLDFAAPTGTPIMAVAGGTITDVGYSGAYGNRTIETLADGTELWYCHQNEFGTTVGATVRPGEVIGYIGSTGNVTGPHLHLEVHPGGGDPVDPYAALVAHGLYPGPPN